MREILFRGQKIGNKEWIEGNYITDEQEPNRAYIGYLFGVDCHGYVHDTDVAEVIPETVCQYTGLTDKNGKKIFEWDICKTHYANAKRNEFVETIVFNGGRFCAYQDKDGCKSWAGLYDGVPHLAIDKSVYMDGIEVIGNIFDNPELIGDQP